MDEFTAQKWKNYFDEIDKITDIKLTTVQKEKIIQDAINNPNRKKLIGDAYKNHRKNFNKRRARLIKEWEQNTGQIWPTYAEDVLSKNGTVYIKAGTKYDAHEIIPNVYEGPLEWWNIHPAKRPDQHQKGIHSVNSAIKELFE